METALNLCFFQHQNNKHMEQANPVSLYWIIFLGTALLSWLVQALLQSKF